MQLAGMDTDTYAKEASCILSNLRNRVMRLFCQIPSIDIALINLLKSCMEYRCIYSTLIKLLGSFPEYPDTVLYFSLGAAVLARPEFRADPESGLRIEQSPAGHIESSAVTFDLRSYGMSLTTAVKSILFSRSPNDRPGRSARQLGGRRGFS